MVYKSNSMWRWKAHIRQPKNYMTTWMMFDVFPGRLKLLYIDSCIFQKKHFSFHLLFFPRPRWPSRASKRLGRGWGWLRMGSVVHLAWSGESFPDIFHRWYAFRSCCIQKPPLDLNWHMWFSMTYAVRRVGVKNDNTKRLRLWRQHGRKEKKEEGTKKRQGRKTDPNNNPS